MIFLFVVFVGISRTPDASRMRGKSRVGGWSLILKVIPCTALSAKGIGYQYGIQRVKVGVKNCEN